MRLRENAHRGKLQPWDRYDHGTGKPDLELVYSHFHDRGCDFGSSGPGEITVRNPGAHYTVYISRRSDGRWRVGHYPNDVYDFNTWDEMIKALHRQGF